MSFQINTTTKVDTDRLVRLNSGGSGSRPASPTIGMLFFNTTSGKIEVWNGSAWKEAAPA